MKDLLSCSVIRGRVRGIRQNAKRKSKQRRRQTAPISGAVSNRLAFVNPPRTLHVLRILKTSFDAVVCVLAGHDFVAGRAMNPDDRKLAEREGWIWTAKPHM